MVKEEVEQEQTGKVAGQRCLAESQANVASHIKIRDFATCLLGSTTECDLSGAIVVPSYALMPGS